MHPHAELVVIVPRKRDQRLPTDVVSVALFGAVPLGSPIKSDTEKGNGYAMHPIAITPPEAGCPLNGAHTASDGLCNSLIARIARSILSVRAVD